MRPPGTSTATAALLLMCGTAAFAPGSVSRLSPWPCDGKFRCRLSVKRQRRNGGRRKPQIRDDRGAPWGSGDAPPTRTRRAWTRIERCGAPSPDPPLDVCTVEIVDTDWWAINKNPYGARLWPPSLAIARFLAPHLSNGRMCRRQHVLELGCGTGLISIAAAGCGASVLATDVSPAALSLAREGWTETRKRPGTLDGAMAAMYFDLTSRVPLPLPPARDDEEGGSPRCVVVASAVLYESTLAEAVARRVFEACEKGAYFILGDDDTSNREGGAERFEAELAQLENENGVSLRRSCSHEIVQHESFGWTEKRVRILHINPPPHISLEQG